MKDFQLTAGNLDLKSDTFGALASGLCMIHCLATPLIFVAQACSASASTASCCASSPSWWGMLDYLFLVISIVAVYFSAKETTLVWMPAALYASWSFLAFLILNERFHMLHVDHSLVYAPALSLVVLHLYNRKYCNCDTDECCTDE